MKKTITLFTLALSFYMSKAQTVVADFETFTLSPASAYSPSASIPFQTANASFEHSYGFGFWLGGFAYTNVNDSVTAGFSNIYGVRAGKGYTNSANYVVGQNEGIITLSTPNTTVNGFYITNTTYAYKSMASGDQFARKFGDTTGTGSGTTIPQGSYPDFLKLTVKGYVNGMLINDSVEVYLANFTFTNNAQDFILDSWQYVNIATLGKADSIQFFMYSSDNGNFGMNTPAFFAIDNFETTAPTTVGLENFSQNTAVRIYPNPFRSGISLESTAASTDITLLDAGGKTVYSQLFPAGKTEINLSELPAGIYFMQIKTAHSLEVKKLIKN